MADLISRDEFVMHLADIQYGEAPTGREGEDIGYQTGVYAGLDMAYVALMRFPAADVRPMHNAEWKRPSEATPRSWIFRCNRCNDIAYYPIPKGHVARCGYKYCPNCGAHMREVQR